MNDAVNDAGPLGAILCGGASRRMGRDKAFVEVGGVALVVRVESALRAGGCARVVCQGGDAARLRSLGLAVLADPHPGAGPVPAILAALGHACRSGAPGVVVAACDLVDLGASAVAAVVAAAEDGAEAAVAATPSGLHLLAWFSCATTVAVTDAVAGGRQAFRDLAGAVGAVEVAVAPVEMTNLNDPADLHGRG